MLKHLFSPFVLKGLTIRNRSVVPAMVTNYCNADGTCTERFTKYHEAKSKGGFGLIITEDFAVCPEGRGFPCLPGLWNDAQIRGYSEFTRRVKSHGAALIAQIYHAGRQTTASVIGQTPLAPSAVPGAFSAEAPRELTLEEIKDLVEKFGDCARRAEAAGFDGVEIHGAHGYLIAQFLSPYSNKRTDEYGGNIQNRLRFALQIIKNVRKKCSDKFIVGFRISGDEFVSGGRTIEDTKNMLPFLEDAGIDYIHVSAGVYRSFDAVIPSMYCEHAWLATQAAQVKQVSSVPVITVGRVNDPFMANAILEAGCADLVAMGRQSLADPATIHKAHEGDFKAIRQCIACNQGCVGNLLEAKPITCILNPSLGKEGEIEQVAKKDAKKRVIVVGAGPAGLEAAISAARMGHDVSVYESGSHPGGQFRLGAIPPAKAEIINFINWQTGELSRLGVSITYNHTFKLEDAERLHPASIIIATGAIPIIPAIPGVDLPHVITAQAVLDGKVLPGEKVVVIGGGSVGAETANQIASNMAKVTVVEMLPEIARDEAIVPRWGLLRDLEKNKVEIYTSTTVKLITPDGVKVERQGIESFIPADTIVLAVGSKPDNGLVAELQTAGFDIHIIGDAVKPGLAGAAIEQGFWIGKIL